MLVVTGHATELGRANQKIVSHVHPLNIYAPESFSYLESDCPVSENGNRKYDLSPLMFIHFLPCPPVQRGTSCFALLCCTVPCREFVRLEGTLWFVRCTCCCVALLLVQLQSGISSPFCPSRACLHFLHLSWCPSLSLSIYSIYIYL